MMSTSLRRLLIQGGGFGGRGGRGGGGGGGTKGGGGGGGGGGGRVMYSLFSGMPFEVRHSWWARCAFSMLREVGLERLLLLVRGVPEGGKRCSTSTLVVCTGCETTVTLVTPIRPPMLLASAVSSTAAKDCSIVARSMELPLLSSVAMVIVRLSLLL